MSSNSSSKPASNDKPSNEPVSSSDQPIPHKHPHVSKDQVENDASFGREKGGEQYWNPQVEKAMEEAVENVEKEVEKAEKLHHDRDDRSAKEDKDSKL